ncbi:hypothetical protein HY522_12120 [bacterium]|nr:hypothetical protein [bacterium]
MLAHLSIPVDMQAKVHYHRRSALRKVLLAFLVCPLFSSCTNDVSELKKENERLKAELDRPTPGVAAPRNISSIKNPVIEIRKLKIYQLVSSVGSIDVKITNRSDAFIRYWSVTAEVYDKNGEYLGQGSANGHNLRPAKDAIDRIGLIDIRASDVREVKFRLRSIRIEENRDDVDATGEFDLREVK